MVMGEFFQILFSCWLHFDSCTRSTAIAFSSTVYQLSINVFYIASLDCNLFSAYSSTIRAFEAGPALSSRMSNFIDRQQHAYYLLRVGTYWLAIRLEFIGTLLIAFGCLGFVLHKHASTTVDEVFASMAGLALSYLLTTTSSLVYAIRLSSDFEASLVSVERIQQYIEVEKEAPHHNPTDVLLDNEWPSKGSIKFDDYRLRYRPGLPLVLKGLNITIPSQAKVGIVGRTGEFCHLLLAYDFVICLIATHLKFVF